MSKHNGYMIGKQRLSRLTRPRLMALAVKLDGERAEHKEWAERYRQDAQAANNILEAAVCAGENIRADRDQEREYHDHWKSEAEVARSQCTTYSTRIDALETDLSRERAVHETTKLALETRKALHAASRQHAKWMFRTLVFVVGIVLVWALSR